VGYHTPNLRRSCLAAHSHSTSSPPSRASTSYNPQNVYSYCPIGGEFGGIERKYHGQHAEPHSILYWWGVVPKC